jgi:ribonuclease D
VTAAFRTVDRAESLAATIERWSGSPELALDTEFVFERTFRPHLGLVQAAAGGEIALIDAVALPDLAPLAPLLEAPRVLKLVHSGAADVDVLRRAAGVAPRPLLDTQIAAAFAGLGPGLSYAALVERLTGVVLDKHETRTDWLRRPLRPEQLRYAAEDVEHLPAVARELGRRLRELGRLDWALEDSAAVAADPGEGPRRVKGLDRLPPAARRLARALADWREREAERLDLARPFLLRDETLVALARRGAAGTEDLPRLPGYDARRHARHHQRWLAALEEARAAVERGDAGDAQDSAPHLPGELLRRAGKELAGVVARRGAALGLEPELLLSRRQRDRLLRSWDGRGSLSRGLAGFRRDLLADDVEAAGRAALAATG